MIKIMLTITLLIFINTIIFSQGLEQENMARKSLQELRDNLIKQNSSNEPYVMDILSKNIQYCEKLKNLLDDYNIQNAKLEKSISLKMDESGKIDLSESYIKISGIVGSVESGYSMIKTDKGRFSVKGIFNYNQRITGYIKRIDGRTNFRTISGSNFTLDNYKLVKGVIPKEKYIKLTATIENEKRIKKELYEKFIENCIIVVDAEIVKIEELILKNHYQLGEEYFIKGDFKNAMIEFAQVLKLNADYLNIREKYNTAKISYYCNVKYKVHIADIGWMDWVENNEIAGDIEQGKRIEAIIIDSPVSKEYLLKYQVHVAGIGWMDWKSNGQIAGTTGQSRRIEAIKIRLLNCNICNLKYRAYAQGIGWMDWVSNGEIAGTTGEYRQLEAIEIFISKNP